MGVENKNLDVSVEEVLSVIEETDVRHHRHARQSVRPEKALVVMTKRNKKLRYQNEADIVGDNEAETWN